jgi:hypothetical protein
LVCIRQRSINSITTVILGFIDHAAPPTSQNFHLRFNSFSSMQAKQKGVNQKMARLSVRLILLWHYGLFYWFYNWLQDAWLKLNCLAALN